MELRLSQRFSGLSAAKNLAGLQGFVVPTRIWTGSLMDCGVQIEHGRTHSVAVTITDWAACGISQQNADPTECSADVATQTALNTTGNRSPGP